MANTLYTNTTPGFGSWTVPTGVTKVTIGAWGPGGKGTNYVVPVGGGGGGFAGVASISVTPGSTIYFRIGYGSNSSVGAYDTSWINISANAAPTTTANGCYANGGTGAYLSAGGSGGSGYIGTFKYSGGDGTAPEGGGGAGSGGNASASGAYGIYGGPDGVYLLGAGGNGGSSSVGFTPGGGGSNPNNGGNGKIAISYLPSTYQPSDFLSFCFN